MLIVINPFVQRSCVSRDYFAEKQYHRYYYFIKIINLFALPILLVIKFSFLPCATCLFIFQSNILVLLIKIEIEMLVKIILFTSVMKMIALIVFLFHPSTSQWSSNSAVIKTCSVIFCPTECLSTVNLVPQCNFVMRP